MVGPDANYLFAGFVREADGTLNTFDAPAAGTGAEQGTGPLSIGAEGVIAGWYIDANNGYHGFLRGCDARELESIGVRAGFDFHVPSCDLQSWRGLPP